MKELDSIGLVRQAYEAFDKGDIPRLLSTFSNDIVWTMPEIEGIKFTGNRRGIAQAAEFFEQMSEMQEPRVFVADEFIGQGDRVVVLGHCTWAIKATGDEYSDQFCHVFQVKNGKIARFQEYSDTHQAALAYQPIISRKAGKAASRPTAH
jgi:ketosteroid isomerase-like protein